LAIPRHSIPISIRTSSGSSGIFSQTEYDANSDYQKTGAIMKMVINGFAGAGTIEMSGFDYHGQGRATGEDRKLSGGRMHRRLP